MSSSTSHHTRRSWFRTNLLDRRVVQERLQRSEPGHVGHDPADHPVGLFQRPHRTRQRPSLVLGHHLVRDLAYRIRVRLRVEPPTSHLLAHPLRERRLHRIHH
ncbi:MULTISPECIES: hypothetical protein [unclassified Aeromicrobium]|uniref:hypothetical protein n=1 Tax=unclassified Aeromicrobium TaxID=2633570 RepID=UPI000B17D63B|nr:MULTISPECIES: hypothetical protein [unclassified Aeromicrobium]